MIGKILVASALLATTACRISLDEDPPMTVPADADPSIDANLIDAAPSAACVAATQYQDLQNIENKIFKVQCTFRGCHNGEASDAGATNLLPGHAYAALLDKDSNVSNGRKLVVAGDPAASYLMVMIGQIAPGDASPPGGQPPADIGFMPQDTGGVLLCPEKRAAIERWIMAGAPM